MFAATKRPLIMGILNLTPDSFSDGGSYCDISQAVSHARTMASEGADIIDVGGESTRPGAQPVPEAVQIQRVIPVLRSLRAELPGSVYLSIDTTRASVAAAAIEVGAGCVNDISAGCDGSDMLPLVAQQRVPIVLMHMQGTPATMQVAPHYTEVVAEVVSFLQRRIEAAVAAGIEPHRIAIDPGIGFGKKREHNLQLLGHLADFVALGHPVLLGTSRKRFMGSLCNEEDPKELVAATCATTALGVSAGVCCFRVHDVRANRQAADVAWAIVNGSRVAAGGSLAV